MTFEQWWATRPDADLDAAEHIAKLAWNYAALVHQPEELQIESKALALLRELNDALVIPGWLQPRVDAVLDRAEEK